MISSALTFKSDKQGIQILAKYKQTNEYFVFFPINFEN